MPPELILRKGTGAIKSNATAIAEVGCQRYSLKCIFISGAPAGRSTLPTDSAASVLLYTQISTENSICVNDRYPHPQPHAAAGAGERLVGCAAPEPFTPQALRASGNVSLVASADLDKADEKSGKSTYCRNIRTHRSPGTTATPRRGDAPGLPEYQLSL